MECGTSSAENLPIHVIIGTLKFAVPEMLSLGEARILCTAAATALSIPSFWEDMSACVDRDEDKPKPRKRRCSAVSSSPSLVSPSRPLPVRSHPNGITDSVEGFTQSANASPTHTKRWEKGSSNPVENGEALAPTPTLPPTVVPTSALALGQELSAISSESGSEAAGARSLLPLPPSPTETRKGTTEKAAPASAVTQDHRPRPLPMIKRDTSHRRSAKASKRKQATPRSNADCLGMILGRGKTADTSANANFGPAVPNRTGDNGSGRKDCGTSGDADGSKVGKRGRAAATSRILDSVRGGPATAAAATAAPAGPAGPAVAPPVPVHAHAIPDAGGDVKDAESTRSWRQYGADAGKHFLRRYHHSVAFRRSASPVTDTEKISMPVPLFPTCLDACGCMVAVGTRAGPVIIFDVGPQQESLQPDAAAVHGGSIDSGSNNGNNSNGNDSNSSNSNSNSSNTDINSDGGGDVKKSSVRDTSDNGRVYRVCGSLSDGTGPISAVLLDRAKLIAAGRGSRRSGGGHVIRIYAVDSTRLLRTLRCQGQVSRMYLSDPLLVVRSSASGTISFRDIYADDGRGLGQGSSRGIAAAAFAPVEARDQHGTPEDNSNGLLLHCVNRIGTIFEASTLGTVRNAERDADVEAGGEDAGESQGLGGDERGWHVCADMDASVLVKATPWGKISGWKLRPNGCRVAGRVFSFPLLSSSSPSTSLATRSPTSVSLSAGGDFLATTVQGCAPCLWDVRLIHRQARRRNGDDGARSAIPRAASAPSSLSLSPSSAVLQPAMEGVLRGACGADVSGGGDQAGGLGEEHADEQRSGYARQRPSNAGQRQGAEPAVSDGRGSRAGVVSGEIEAGGGWTALRGRGPGPAYVEVRPWPAGAWAVGVSVGAYGGRLVSACVDGHLRVTNLRPSISALRWRNAVLRGRDRISSSQKKQSCLKLEGIRI